MEKIDFSDYAEALFKIAKAEGSRKDVEENLLRLLSSFQKKVTAHVISAIPLTEDIIGEMEKRLSILTGKDIVVKNEVDETIIGGFIIRTKEKVLDASISGQLEKLKEELLRKT